MSGKESTILAIETSCDETAAAVLKFTLEGKTKKNFPSIITLSSIIKSQIELHSKMGGVVPETAARAHIQNILPVVQKALTTADCPLSTIQYIAVTQGPGLIPSLIVGVEFAKALSLATNKPLVPVNHMAGHLYSPLGKIQNLIRQPAEKIKALFPQIALIVSGGHTMLVLMENEKKYKVIGQTVDDAAGEAFDKVAKLLKLPYPGGPEVSKLAAQAKSTNISFPRPMIHDKSYNFSFAGLKTSVLYFLQSISQSEILNLKSEICKAFQDAVVDVLVTKTLRAAKQYKAKSISLSGGVSANTLLRETLRNRCLENSLTFFVPPFKLSTDNAEIIGIAAAFKLHNGYKPKRTLNLKADPNLEL